MSVRGRLVAVAAGLVVGVSGCSVAGDGGAESAAGAAVQTDAGPVRGRVAGDHRLFQGLPYAAPPVGELRWRPPEPVRPWTEVRDATEPGSRCPQPARGPYPASAEEDCLYLNVTTPLGPSARPRPVMVWLHGGTDVGAGSDSRTARFAVEGDVVLVTVNFRLTLFGNFAHPDLPDSGDFQLQDQQAALRWVQRNAAAFGGDPGNVTVFGESRGSIDTCAQLTSPGAAGLFQRVILQSGPCNWGWPSSGFVPGLPASTIFVPFAFAQQAGAQLAAARGCDPVDDPVDCLRGVPAGGAQGLATPENLGAAFSFGSFGNTVLPAYPHDALLAGRFPDVSVMIGTTKDEMRLFVNDYAPPTTPDGYRALLETAFGESAARVAERYSLARYESPDLAWAAVTTDQMFACRTVATAQALATKAPTYAYEFADPNAPPVLALNQPSRFPLGAYHASDLLYTMQPTAEFTLTPEQQQLNDQMIRYWTNFARTGDPNGPGLPQWSTFNDTRNAQSLAPGPGGITPVDVGTEHNCDLWRELG